MNKKTIVLNGLFYITSLVFLTLQSICFKFDQKELLILPYFFKLITLFFTYKSLIYKSIVSTFTLFKSIF